MSGKQLADRLGVTKGRVSTLELSEPSGAVTLKSMHSAAEAMNCRFVYALVPNDEVGRLISAQATLKAKARVKAASTQMALEAQSLSVEQLKAEVERIAKEIAEELPADLWDKP